MDRGRQRLGRRAEELVAGYLSQRGWQVLQRNYRCRWGEVDLVARDGDCLVFVEVRAKRGDAFGTPLESITAKKMARLRSTAETYLQENGLADRSWRIDVAALELTRQGGVRWIEVLENAVGAGTE